jgi:hypothetical protein
MNIASDKYVVILLAISARGWRGIQQQIEREKHGATSSPPSMELLSVALVNNICIVTVKKLDLRRN